MAVNYKFDILNLVTSQAVRSDCADITFYNQGLATITLNNAITITAGNSISFNANNGEIDRTIYNIIFGTGISKCVVFRKVYI